MRSLKEIMAGLPWAMHRDDVRWENLMKRERALEVENAELRASLETAVGANAMWKRLYDELRAVIDSRDKAAGFEPLRSETAESKEVCTVAHDDCVLGVGEPNFCPYCEIERLINESEEMRKVRLMLYAERDYARQAARNADAKLAEAETLLREAIPAVQSYARKHGRSFVAAARRNDAYHVAKHADIEKSAWGLADRIRAYLAPDSATHRETHVT